MLADWEYCVSWDSLHCESSQNLLTWGKIALRSKKSSSTINNGVFLALKVQIIIVWSVLLFCLREVPWLHGASIFNVGCTHFPIYCLLIAPYFHYVYCELLSVWRARLGYCQTSEESRFDSRQGKSSKVPRRAVGPTQPPANNWSSLPGV